MFIGACASAQNQPCPQPSTQDLTEAAQTKRVVQDGVLQDILKNFEKKYNVNCEVPVSDDPGNVNPRWTCLNNNACSYKVTAVCTEKDGDHRPAIQIVFEGYDDGNDTEIQALHVVYLIKP